MYRNFASPAVALMLLVGLAAACAAQDPVLAHFYGSGVHNYYERDWSQAMENLSAAIEGGTDDPRPYYYRGLTHMQMGNSDAAIRDLQRAAALESADVNQAYPVGRSLERLQGSQRVALERYRAKARAQAYARQVRRDAVRYEQLRRAESQVLRQAPLGPPPSPLRPPGEMPAAAVAPVVPPAPGAAPPAAPAPAAPPAAPTPFDTPAAGDDASPFDAPADPPPAEAPPAEAPAAEAEPAADAAAEPEKMDEDNPFGDEPK
jgi:tetratricopeptide (TPR) repeat protein